MKEKDIKEIENCNFEQLMVMDELLYLEEARGVDVAETREKIWETVNKRLKREENPYEGCTKEELQNLLLQAQRLEEEGIGMTETIVNIEEVLEPKINSGIIYEAE